MTRGVDLLLGGLALLLVGVIALELAPRGPDRGIAVLAPRPHRPTGTHAPAPDRTDAWVATMLDRPLFNPTRRPSADAARPGGAVAGPAVMPRLAGILIGPAGGRAIFAPADGGKPLVLTTGGTVAGATIHAIRSGSVVLSGPDGDQVLRPSFDHAAAPTAAAGQFRLSPGLAPDALIAPPNGPLSRVVGASEGDARQSPNQTPPGIQP